MAVNMQAPRGLVRGPRAEAQGSTFLKNTLPHSAPVQGPGDRTLAVPATYSGPAKRILVGPAEYDVIRTWTHGKQGQDPGRTVTESHPDFPEPPILGRQRRVKHGGHRLQPVLPLPLCSVPKMPSER